jgi:polyphosphate kinase 2
MTNEKGGKGKKKTKESGGIHPGEIAEVIAIEGKAAPEEEKKKKKDKKEKKKKGGKKGKKQKKTTLKEHTAFENIDKKKSKNRQAVWIRKSTLKYEEELHKLQIELSKWQRFVIENDQRFLLIFEGRDAAGKGGTIKRIVEYLNPRGARVVALLKPSDREKTQWYFQRYFQQLPAGGEIVLFDRSWYNRAMVEPTMGFCTDEEHKRFLKDVPMIEEILVKNGIVLFKFFFSISKEQQKQRFASRMKDPLKLFKISPVDLVAQEKWDDYTV